MLKHSSRAFIGLILSLVACCCDNWVVDADDLPPLYLTIVIHTEEDTAQGVFPKANIPNYDGDEALMRHFAMAMTAFAQMAARHGAVISFGSDWTFSRGVALYEPDFYANIEALGHDVDAHAHESHVLYRQVREEIAAAGGHPTRVASGLNEEEIQERLTYFDTAAPEFQVLWGISLPGHGAGECTAPWVWRPSRDDWTQHDPNGNYIYVGHGELVNSIQAVRQAAENRNPERMNTIAVFTTPREFKAALGSAGLDEAWTASKDSVEYWENRIAWWDNFLAQIASLRDAGIVEFATVREIAAIFEEREADLRFNWEDVPRSALSLRTRNLKADYPLEN
ncbi:hypothetical protein KKG90_09670 [Candidatus Bipolaricaulota bacterium]|nr:hypothetical protein [Candidatus Bipolaricaulota bacterium]